MSEHKTAIVVGVGAEIGVGGAVCKRFAREGHHVFIAGRTAEKINTVADVIKSGGGAATGVVTDTTNEADVIRLFDIAEKEGPGPLDVVIYNAGNNFMKDILDMEAEFFENVWRVGCFGGFLVGREAGRRIFRVVRARCCLLAQPVLCAASRPLARLQRQKPASGLCVRQWRVTGGRKAFTWRT